MSDEPKNALVVVRREEIPPSNLIAAAIEKGMAPEALEKLLEMRRQLQQEEARHAFFEAFAAFQGDCPAIPKTKQVCDKNGKPRYKYAPLGDIQKAIAPYLAKHGFSYRLVVELKPPHMIATCVIHHVGGHVVESIGYGQIDTDSYMTQTQRLGSARTFACRYALMDAFGLAACDEDDDGAAETPAKAPSSPPAASRPPQAPAGPPTLSKEQYEALGKALVEANVVTEQGNAWFGGIVAEYQVARVSQIPAADFDILLRDIKNKASYVVGDESEIPFGDEP